MNIKKGVTKYLLPIFYAFCVVSLIVASINVYNIKMSENRLLKVKRNVNIEEVGDDVKLELTEKNKNEKISYNIKNNDIVKVNDDGKLVGIKEGSTEVIVTNKDKTKKQVITVNVGKEAIADSKKNDGNKNNSNNNNNSSNNNSNINKNNTNNNNNSNNNNTNNSNSSSNNNKPNINPTINVTGIYLNKGNTEIFLNNSNSFSISATVTPSNATNKTVYWSSSNSNIASVNNGYVTAHNPGVATITARTANGNKSASIKVTVKKKVIIVIGASQVTRMAWYKNSYSSSRYNYNTNNGTLVYVNGSGSGIDWQYGSGLNSAKSTINSYSSYKVYTYFYIFFPLSGNTIKNFSCDSISSNNSSIKSYASGYNNAIQGIKNNGFNVKGYVVSMHPVKVSQRGNNDKIVTNENSNSCKAGYRSNYKYFQFNKAIKHIIENNYSNNLKYESLFIKIMDTKDGRKENYSYKITYNTTDGIHWDSSTTNTYVNMMLGYTFDL